MFIEDLLFKYVNYKSLPVQGFVIHVDEKNKWVLVAMSHGRIETMAYPEPTEVTDPSELMLEFADPAKMREDYLSLSAKEQKAVRGYN